MPQPADTSKLADGASVTIPPKTDPKAVAEREQDTVSQPGQFKNDPDDSTNPNEEIERYKEKLRPAPLRS